MKQGLPKGSLILFMCLLCAVACKKTSAPTTSDNEGKTQLDSNTVLVIPYPESKPGCDFAPDYGDSIVYPQPNTGGDFFVYPQNNQAVDGTYLSWPGGLVIDPKTGAIDLTKSETGQRFSVAFVKAGSNDTCMSQLIVAGAAYMDSVYVLSQSQRTAIPYYNADPSGPAPCVGNQGQGCKFDYNNLAHNQGIEIDQKTGYIDLQKTMQKSPFGILPINGTTVLTTIQYKLNDNSNFAPQQIQLKMVYYNHRSDIPNDILANVTNSIFNTLNDLLLGKSTKTRPPLIIIVRQN